MKKNFCTFILVLISGILLYAERPSLDGRAIIAPNGEFPPGLFAKTIGYLPGDFINVKNPETNQNVDILVIGSLDSSEGVAIMLSPEAATSLGITRSMSNLVKLTKRAGDTDEPANGTAVLSKIDYPLPDDTLDEDIGTPLDANPKDDFIESSESLSETTEEDTSTAYPEKEIETPTEVVDETILEEEVLEPVEVSSENENPELSTEDESLPESYEELLAQEEKEQEEKEIEPPEEIVIPADDEVLSEEEAYYEENVIKEEEIEKEDNPIEEAATLEDDKQNTPLEDEECPYAEQFDYEELAVDEPEIEDEEFEYEEPIPEEEEPEPESEEFAYEIPAEEQKEKELESEKFVDDTVAKTEEEPETEQFNSEEVPQEKEEEIIPQEVIVSEELPTEENQEPPTETAEEPEPQEEESPSETSPLEDEYEAIVLVPTDENPPESTTEEETKEAEEVVPPKEETKPETTPITPSPKIVSSNSELVRGKYYVQIGVYSSQDYVDEIKNKYGTKYPLTIISSNGGAKNIVMVGPLSIDEYGTILERFKSYGFKDAFIKKAK